MRSACLIIQILLLFILSGCNFDEVEATKQYTLTIHAVEYYSRTSVEYVEILVKDDKNNKIIGREIVDKDGIAKFKGFEPSKQYTVYVYQLGTDLSFIQSQQSFIYDETKNDLFIETALPNAKNGLSVPLVLQNPELPNGCEITALTAILNYYGENVSKLTMSDKYLPKATIEIINNQRIGPDPNIAYAGNPKSSNSGFYVYPTPIVKAANDYLAKQNSQLEAYDITGQTLDQLNEQLAKGIPVLAWTTTDLQPARTSVKGSSWIISGSDEVHSIYSNLHVVVLLGMDEQSVYVMNPLSGYEHYDKAAFQIAYESLGNKAVIVY